MPFDLDVGSLTWYGGDEKNHCAEAYQAIFEFNQEIKGIPNGLYRIDLQAFSRTRAADLAWLERDSSFVISEFYANSISLPIKNLMHNTFTSNGEDFSFVNANMPKHLFNWSESIWQCMDGTYVPNNLQSTSLTFLKGYFNQSLYCIVDEGTIKIGIRERRKKTGSWVAWDNFRLTYLSENVENYKEGLRCHQEKAIETEILAKKKGINTQQLSESLMQLEQVLQTEDIDSMRKSMLSINHAINQVRNLLEVQEFGDMIDNSVVSYSQIIEEENNEDVKLENQQAKQDSLKHTLDKTDSYLHMGYMVIDQSKELAQKHFQKAFDMHISLPVDYIDPFDVCVVDLTSICIEKGQYDEAICIWQKLINWLKLSKYRDTRYNIAIAFYEMGNIFLYLNKNYKQAEELYKNSKEIMETLNKEATELNEKTELLSYICNELAYALAHQKQYDEALRIIERSISLQSNNPIFYDSKGEILYMKGDKNEAIAMWRKVLELEPDFPQKANSQLYKLLFEK